MAVIDWEQGCKDAMWSMFWVAREHGNTNADEENLKENVARLIRMATQKDAGPAQTGEKRGLERPYSNTDEYQRSARRPFA